ncbi:MAG: hypothetical protein ACRENB_16240 [Gemmatimonadales bacterium]
MTAPGECRGTALVEVLCALTILSVIGFTAAGALRETAGAMRGADAGEREMEAAERVLTALTLLTRRELSQRLGTRRVGEFAIRIHRPEADLFRIAVGRDSGVDHEILATVVHRPAGPAP